MIRMAQGKKSALTSAMNSLATEPVSADAQRSARQNQNRDAQARSRRRLELVTRRIVFEREWLDTLEDRISIPTTAATAPTKPKLSRPSSWILSVNASPVRFVLARKRDFYVY
jgi:hypothetical protein